MSQSSATQRSMAGQPTQATCTSPERFESSASDQQALKIRLFYSKAGSVVAAVLIAAGSALDHFAYPDRLEEFMRVRGIVALTLLGIWGLLHSRMGERHVRSIAMAWLMIPQVMIAWMIHDTQGAESSYFAGLILALFALGTVLPVTFVESAAFGGATLLLYALASYTHAKGLDVSALFFTHGLFILMAAITAAICAWLNERSRARMQCLKDEVLHKNTELQEINHSLSQIKGQLIEREKMVAIGSLSSALLQDLNTPVNLSMLAIGQGLSMSAVKGDKMLAESLQDARESIERVRTIVADLRHFAHPAPDGERLQPFTLDRALRSAIRLSSGDLKGIPVVVDLKNEMVVVGDEPALIGVLITLLSNAGQAVRSTKLLHPEVRLRGELIGDRVRITVRDNGPAIEKDAIGRVFGPFFTTRGIGSGLGLGLSLCQAMVLRHGSRLTVQSEPGAWTTFSFDLATA